MNVQVQCYSGYKANERPISFILGERKFMVEEILDQWYGIDYIYFKLRADDKNTYVLKWDEKHDEWGLEMFIADFSCMRPNGCMQLESAIYAKSGYA